MTASKKWFQTAAIDYPNSRPHIGTAFEKLGADVQARYRRMEGYDVTFLMGNDENTLKVADRAKELGLDPQAYCDDMARQFREVWDALDISYDVFVQTSHERHKQCCRAFIQKVYDNGYIVKGEYEGWYCSGCEEFKGDKVHKENAGNCPNHRRPLERRKEPCYYFKLSQFQDRLLANLKDNPGFVQPESRRNEMIGLIETDGLEDLNISRFGQTWGLRLPFDESYTVYVWFDALLTYISGIGYGDDQARFQSLWPCDVHFIGKDITRFHSLTWPAMCWAAGIELPKHVFSHGFVNVDGTKMGKSMGNVVQPLDVVAKSSVDAYRYYFMKECAFPNDNSDYSGQRFEEVYNHDLANTLGNLLSRTVTIPAKSLNSVFPSTAGRAAEPVSPDYTVSKLVEEFRSRVESCEYHQALQALMTQLIYPANKYIGDKEPWKVVKVDQVAASHILHNVVEVLRIAAILLKPFIPRSAEVIYRSFNFPTPWEQVTFAHAAEPAILAEDLRVLAEMVGGKPPQLFPKLV